MPADHCARLFFVADGKAFASFGLFYTQEAANEVCANNPHAAVIDSNALGHWIANKEGKAAPTVLVDALRSERRATTGLVFSNPHVRLCCASMGKVFEVEEIDPVGVNPEDHASRRARKGLVLIGNLPDGCGIYGEQYAPICASCRLNPNIWLS